MHTSMPGFMTISGMSLVPLTRPKVTGLEFTSGVCSRSAWILAMFHVAAA